MSGRRTSELLSAIAGAYDDQRVAEAHSDVPVWEPTPATTAQIAAATTHVCPICGRIHLPPEPDGPDRVITADQWDAVRRPPEPPDLRDTARFLLGLHDAWRESGDRVKWSYWANALLKAAPTLLARLATTADTEKEPGA